MRAAFARARGEHSFQPQGKGSSHLHGIRFPQVHPTALNIGVHNTDDEVPRCVGSSRGLARGCLLCLYNRSILLANHLPCPPPPAFLSSTPKNATKTQNPKSKLKNHSPVPRALLKSPVLLLLSLLLLVASFLSESLVIFMRVHANVCA